MGASDRAARRLVRRLSTDPLRPLVDEVHDLRLWTVPSFRYLNGVDALFTRLAHETDYDAVKACAVVEGVVSHHPEYASHSTYVLDSVLNLLARWTDAPSDADARLVRAVVSRLPLAVLVHARAMSSDEGYVTVRRALEAMGVLPEDDAVAFRKREGTDEMETTCPITLERAVDPVTASDGHVYERLALVTHMLTRGATSPLTREHLDVRFAGECDFSTPSETP